MPGDLGYSGLFDPCRNRSALTVREPAGDTREHTLFQVGMVKLGVESGTPDPRCV